MADETFSHMRIRNNGALQVDTSHGGRILTIPIGFDAIAFTHELERFAVQLRRDIEARQKPAYMVCTAASPMPENRDQMGQHWRHEDAQQVVGLFDRTPSWYCPNCKLRF